MKLTGLTKVIANINLKTMRLSGDMEKMGTKAGFLVERRAKENISGKHGHQRHIITGNLRSSIKTKPAKRVSPTAVVVEIGTDVFYAAPVEARDKTGGYLKPALSETKQQVEEYISRTIKGELNLL